MADRPKFTSAEQEAAWQRDWDHRHRAHYRLAVAILALLACVLYLDAHVDGIDRRLHHVEGVTLVCHPVQGGPAGDRVCVAP